ncbi:MAG: hypothetical protein ACI9MC_000195 [Kiritimatiellia bacterium]|jgi:hypothetical protein
MREVTQAHYLHERSGLDPVLRPPVDDPSCLSWLPGTDRLVVGNRGGELFEVDPVMGTQRKAQGLGCTCALGLHADLRRYVVLSIDGSWSIGELGGEVLWTGKHGFSRRMSVFFHREYVVMVGDRADGRFVIIVAGGKIAAQIRVPHRAIAMVGRDDKLKLVRSTQQGLDVQPLSRNPRVADRESTAHRLRAYPNYIVGFTVIGLIVWPRDGGPGLSLRLTDLGVATLSPDGSRVGMGTRSGAVAMARLETPETRANPDLVRAFEESVRAIEFSGKGRWMATAGGSLVVWTWDA